MTPSFSTFSFKLLTEGYQVGKSFFYQPYLHYSGTFLFKTISPLASLPALHLRESGRVQEDLQVLASKTQLPVTSESKKVSVRRSSSLWIQ